MTARTSLTPDGPEVEYSAPRRGRPRVEDGRRTVVRFLVTEGEREELEARVDAEGTTMSRLIRGLLWPSPQQQVPEHRDHPDDARPEDPDRPGDEHPPGDGGESGDRR